MYIATVPNRNSPPAILLRESYRDTDKVRTRTIANITTWLPERIEALRRTLKGEFDQAATVSAPQCAEVFGTLFALKKLADEVGITRALGNATLSKHALFLILARIAHQGSRLSAVRFAQQHAVEDILDLKQFDEDDLYEALDWAAAQQSEIEKKLYSDYVSRTGKPPALVLYDVTSSYFEGEQNELAAYGYNRDGKKGKKQIVIGLLTSVEGEPLAIRVFQGNTSDPHTVFEQIEALKNQFSITEIIFVGDRGMVKAKGKTELNANNMRYITALTDAQVRTLLKKNRIQPELFDDKIAEVEETEDGKRYILRRNDLVRNREAKRVEDKLKRLEILVDARNEKTQKSLRASAEKGLEKLQNWVKKYRLNKFITLTLIDRKIKIHADEAAKAEWMLLDGCYVMETDVGADILTAEQVDTSYRNLQKVERDFRTLKTGFLEVRPIFVRKKTRTEGHVFISMLALKITRAFEERLQKAFGTTEEDPHTPTLDDALEALSRFIFLRYQVNGKSVLRLPQPDDQQHGIFKALGISLPRKKTGM